MIRRLYARTAIGAAACALLLATAGCASDPAGGAESLSRPIPAQAHFTPQEDGVPAPDFTAALVDGTEVTLSKLSADRVVVLQFTASWCEQCQEAEPVLTQLAQDFDGAVLPMRIMLKESLEDVQGYTAEYRVTGPTVTDTDGRIWRDYAVSEPPLTAVVDTAGGVIRMWPGGAPEDELRSTLNHLVQLSPR